MEDCAGLLALAHSLNIQVVGVAFHVGSGATNPQAFADAIAAARQVGPACCMCCCWTFLRPVCPLLVPVSSVVLLLPSAVQLAFLSELAANHQMHVVCGSLTEALFLVLCLFGPISRPTYRDRAMTICSCA